MELECLCRGLHHLASMSRTVQSMVCHQQQQAVQMHRKARKYTFQQDVEKYEMTFEFQGEMTTLLSKVTMVPVKGITAVVVLASCEGCDGYEIVLGDRFWDYQDKEFLSQSFIRERIQAPLRTSHALTQVLA